MKTWNELSIKDKNDIIRVAVQNGITALPEIRERYNEFAEGGAEETVERVLPEIVKRPSEEDRLSLAKIKQMLPDAESRSDMYYELDPFRHLADEPIKISQNESIDRLYDVYKQSGYPKVSNHRTVFDYLTYPFSKDLNRPSYNPITNTMHLPNSEKAKYDAEGFIPELAHAYQFHGNNADFWGNLFHIPGDIKIGGKSGYKRPGHMEHTAHSVIEPAIYDYVQGYTDSFNPQVYANGGKIHIKEKNRGKFTALKERTGHSASWFKAHGTPAQRKMATFALNARKWKHGDGGYLFGDGGEADENNYSRWDLRQWGKELAQLPVDVWNEGIKPYVVEPVERKINEIAENAAKTAGKWLANKEYIGTHTPKEVYVAAAKGLMDNLNYFDGNLLDISPELLNLKLYDENLWGVPQNTFLLPRKLQEEEFLKAGYIKGKPGDYGLVKNAVGNRDLPVYQTKPDAISRDKLIVLGNQDNTWYGESYNEPGEGFGPSKEKFELKAELENPGNFPTAIYSDNDGNLYQKAWDLNDYGGAGGSVANASTKLLDIVGNPVVVTTGFQPMIYASKGFLERIDHPFRSVNGMVPIIEDNKFKGWSLPEVEIVGKRKKLGSPIVEKALGGHLYDGESEDSQQMYTGFDWWNREPLTDYMDIAYEPIPDNAPKSKGTPLLDTPIMVQTAPTASTAATFGQYMPKYESTPRNELITLGATVAAPFLPSVGELGLQAMNTAFTPSTWFNPVTGAKLLSPVVGTITDAGVQGTFAYEGLNGLWNQGRQGTLLSDPASTLMHGLEVLPLASPAVKVANEVVDFAKSPGRYIFNNLPYKAIDKLPSVGRIREALKTPTRNIFSPSFSDKRVLAADRPLNIDSEQTYNTYRGGDLDTFMARMANHPDLNPNDVRVVDYLSLPDIYRFNKWVDNRYSKLFKRRSNPFSLLLRTPRDYIKLNMEPAFAGPGFVKMNVPHMKALNFPVDATLPHELAHIYRRRDILDVPQYYEGAFFPEILPKGLDSYLTGDELWARGTQLKNYFGITDNSPITADMLKYAAKNYVKDTGQNNNMNQFFHTIMNSTSKMSPEQKKRYKDGWEMAADYISKYSYSNGGPLVEMAMGGKLNGK